MAQSFLQHQPARGARVASIRGWLNVRGSPPARCTVRSDAEAMRASVARPRRRSPHKAIASIAPAGEPKLACGVAGAIQAGNHRTQCECHGGTSRPDPRLGRNLGTLLGESGAVALRAARPLHVAGTPISHIMMLHKSGSHEAQHPRGRTRHTSGRATRCPPARPPANTALGTCGKLAAPATTGG